MDALQYSRDVEQHRLHMLRIRNQTMHIDTKTPDSLGLKHLAVRPKKMQLIEDRRQLIANDNVKLMERMSKIMSSNRQTGGLVKTAGKNAAFRKREVERVAMENRRMVDRLHQVAPVLNSAQLESEYMEHQKDVRTLRKRITRPKRRLDSLTSIWSAESSSYLPAGLDTNSVSSVSDFRKQFIGSRRSSAQVQVAPSPASMGPQNPDRYQLFHGHPVGR